MLFNDLLHFNCRLLSCLFVGVVLHLSVQWFIYLFVLIRFAGSNEKNNLESNTDGSECNINNQPSGDFVRIGYKCLNSSHEGFVGALVVNIPL
jgi:hypothetical protein